MSTSRRPFRRNFRRYLPPRVHQDLALVYSRNLLRWLLIAPLLGVLTGLVITLLNFVILRWLWPGVMRYYLAHPWTIVPGLVAGFVIAGLLMQYFTPDPNQHSTEEIVRSYHEQNGRIDMRPYVTKLAAAVATVGLGGSAALEGPSIYGGGGLGSWLWSLMRRMRLDKRDRRVMLISGAAAGMAAVFRAPLTGLVFALEMPYKDDLAHEALLPSLLSSVVAYMTMVSFVGARPLFNFSTSPAFDVGDLAGSAVLGVGIGLIAMTFAITFRHAREFCVAWRAPHWLKMALGGLLTGLCGLLFVCFYHDGLVPLGPNYEAVNLILRTSHGPVELVVFGVLKLAATLFSLGVGGVSAMFVPLFLTGGTFGQVFAQVVIHSLHRDLYTAVGMAAFIAAGYKTPLAAVVFVAEATGGHAFIIPALIGAAVAYSVSGDASVSGDQRVHEGERMELPQADEPLAGTEP